MNTTKWTTRDTKRAKAIHGMRVHGKSVKSLLAVEESKANRPTVQIGTKFVYGGAFGSSRTFTVTKAVRHGKWVATDGIQTTTFSTKYILNYIVEV